MHIQNPFNTQSFQPKQPQNPMSMHSYQPTQMQNEIPLTVSILPSATRNNKKSTFKFFANAKCRRITTDDNESIPHGWIVKNIQ